jgi:plastocyanin
MTRIVRAYCEPDLRTYGRGMALRRIISSVAVAGTAAALLAGCGGSSTTGTAGATTSSGRAASQGSAIKIDNFAFSPATLTISHGAAVGVTNDDSAAHTATADDGHSFDTGSIAPGKSGQLTAPKPGRYAYHCTIHPFMHGTLVVR